MTFPLVTRREYQRVVDALKLAIVVIDSQPANRKAALADEVYARLRMHRTGSLTPDSCALIGQLERSGEWLDRYAAEDEMAGEQAERIVRVKQSLKEAL